MFYSIMVYNGIQFRRKTKFISSRLVCIWNNISNINNSYDKNVTFNFNKNESGPSGGFIIALSIYDKLVPTDISRGYKISGTGTIDINGLVGEIDGVKYKLKGAVKNKADIFFVPVNNYNEAIKEKNENNYDIDIVKIYKFSDAIKYLESK